MANTSYKIQDISGSTAAANQARDLASLHKSMLGHSPVVLLGSGFLTDFYYTVLPADGLVCGAIAYVDDRAAGFIVATDDPEGFMSRALSRHWLRIGGILFKSVLRSPRRLVQIKEAYQIQSAVLTQDYGPDVGEVLSFGVLPEFRNRDFIRRTSIHLAPELLARAVQQLRAAGKKKIRAIVDKDNVEAQLFYRSHGWRVGLPDVKGWSVPTMEFLLDCNHQSP